MNKNRTENQRPMTLREIVQDTVFQSREGVPSIAEELGYHVHSLYSMLSPKDIENRGHKLGLMDFVRILRKTGDFRALDKLNQEFGRVSFELPEPDKSMTDRDWLRHAARMAKEPGEALAALSTAIADGVIDEGERKRLRKEAFDVIRAAMMLYTALEK